MLWQDRVGMEGGQDWWLQITEALDAVEFMALVVTPNAMRSETVRKEWRYARQEGVCIYPVKGVSNPDFKTLPRWIRDAHFYDLGDLKGEHIGPEWKKFLNDLQKPCHTRRVPFMVEDLPDDFVPRPEEFEQLLNYLRDGTREEPVAITASLSGAGGYGKTTLARALCHDERVKEAFDDGILWVMLGESPGDLTGRVEDLTYTLSGERPGFTNINAATARLVELLADRDILIVIDDVWSAAHLRHFMQGGPRCARLITTRNLDTLPTNARKVEVDAMRQSEAVALLGAGFLAEGEEPLSALAARLGKWPLLLKLVNGTLRDRIVNSGQLLPDALGYINKALDRHGLTFFDSYNAVAREQAVALTLGVSFERLSTHDRMRYGEMAVFPEDVDIPLVTLSKLWGRTGGFDELDTEKLCALLQRLSLLLRFDPTKRNVRLHDVIRKYLIQEQGADLPALHQHLLNAHRLTPARTPSASFRPGWADLSTDEPYLWDHLAYHLKEAGRGEELLATAKDLNFLSAKTLIRKSPAVESDLRAATELYPDDTVLRLLLRGYMQFDHLLNRYERRDDLGATLCSLLQHLHDLAPLTQNLERSLPPPYLTLWHPLPDLTHPALIRTLAGHTREVSDCAISPDTTFIVSASYDKTLKVWDARSGGLSHTLSGHTGEVLGCAVSPDNSYIVSASWDGSLKIWDAKSGKEIRTLTGHRDKVNSCTVSADGSLILSASDDGTLKLWDVRSGRCLRTFYGHNKIGTFFGYANKIMDCAISSDNSFLVSLAEDCTLKVWEAKRGRERKTIKLFEVGEALLLPNGVCSISHDDTLIIVAVHDEIRFLDARTLNEVRKLTRPQNAVDSFALSPDGSFIVSSYFDGALMIWDIERGVARQALTGHTSIVLGCDISSDGSFIVSSAADKLLKVWEVNAEDAPASQPRLTKSVAGCAISADGSFVVSASHNSTLTIWDAETGDERSILTGHIAIATDCAISSDSSLIISASWDSSLKVWDAKSGKELLTLRGHNRGVNSCAFAPNGLFIASASDDTTLRLWDAKSGKEIRTLNGHADMVTSCCVSPDNSFIISASLDQTLKKWDAYSGEELITFSGHVGSVSSCDLSSNGLFMVSASDDTTLKIWDTASGNEYRSLVGHTYVVSSCAVSPDDSLIASVSWDGAAKVWDVKSGKCLTTFHVDGSLLDCAWSPDSRHLVVAGVGGVYFLKLVR